MKISHHDRQVVQNWNDFKQGKLNNLPQELKEHLHKFTNRTLNFSQKTDGKEIVVQDETKQGISGEFSEIITSFQKLKEKNPPKPELNAEKLVFKSDDIYNTKIKIKNNHQLVTFKELQETVEKQVSQGKDISIEDELLRKASFPKNENATKIELRQEDVSKIVEHRHETNNSNSKVGFVRKTTRDMSHLIYPDKIVIPNKIYKKGYTYKLNDCYYDCDGEFLYRVPGMG